MRWPLTYHKLTIAALLACSLFLSLSGELLKAQDTSDTHPPFGTPANELAPVRLGVVSGTIGGLFGLSIAGLNEYWYKNHERTSFHFFDDSREWRGVDKAGHLYSGYFMSRFAGGLYRWSGVQHPKATFAGSITGIVLLSSIEVLDGFSAKWGASWADFGANVTGATVYAAQQLAWQEQRISLKWSVHPVDHPANLAQRADDLYGHTFAERALKDYNGTTYWASANIHSFLPEGNPVPKWFNIAIGYGANNMYGGFRNKWCRTPADAAWQEPACRAVEDRSDLQRYSQFYLSPDIDFSKIPANNKALTTFLTIVNLIKIPAPALEFNTKGKVIFRPVYF